MLKTRRRGASPEAESCSRVYRRTYAALLISALMLSVGACSNSSGDPAEPDISDSVAAASATPSAPASPQYDTEFTVADPAISGPAAQTFGAQEAAAGTDAAVRLSETAFYNEKCIVTKAGQDAEQCAYSLGDSMTPQTRQDWDRSVKAFVKDAQNNKYGSSQGSTNVLSLCFYGAMVGVEQVDGHEWRVNATGPVMVNKKITNITTGIGTDGRLFVAMKSSADMRVLVDDEPQMWHVGRSITYYMVQTIDGWKVDAWNGKWSNEGTTAEH